VDQLHGTADVTVPLAIHSEPLAGQLPRARLTRLAGVGHMPHHVALPELVAALDRLGAA
jgi:pimeloyl-ACP methyl ester carboxylesterase